jgi:hypothetical protein
MPVWTGAENLAPIGIRSPDRPARSQSLYRLSYWAHNVVVVVVVVLVVSNTDQEVRSCLTAAA